MVLKATKKTAKPGLLTKLWAKKKLITALAVIVFFSLFIYKAISQRRNAAIETAVVQKGKVVEGLVLPGEVRATNHAELSFQGSGKLAWIGVKEGDLVIKGQGLAQLDLNSLKQQLEQTEADLRYYQSVADRVLDEVKGNDNDETFSEREKRTQAQAARDKAFRANEIAKQNMANAILRAPFDGVVTRVNFPFTGINVTFSDTQVEIVDTATAYFDISADQVEVIELQLGQKVELIFDAFPDKTFVSKVSYISPTPKLGELGSVYQVKVNLEGGSDLEKLRIGMTGDARFIQAEKTDVLYIRPQFIKTDAKGDYLKTNLKGAKVYIHKGLEGEDVTEIEGSGVYEGLTVFD